MSQNDLIIADQTFPETLLDLSSAFQALGSNSSGTAAPTITYPFQFWADETTDLLKMRNKANTAWLTLAKIDVGTNRWELRADIFQALTSTGFALKNADGTTILSLDDTGALTVGDNKIKGAAVETFSALLKGAVPAPGASNTGFLCADGTWSASTISIGQPFAVWDHIAGCPIPSNAGAAKFIKLTAGLTGSGQYNNGLLTGESLSGTAPAITATATIVGGLMNGQTVALINTEQAFIRPGSTSGVLQADEIRAHAHTTQAYMVTPGGVGVGGAGTSFGINSGTFSSGGAETRPRNRSATFYMRII